MWATIYIPAGNFEELGLYYVEALNIGEVVDNEKFGKAMDNLLGGDFINQSYQFDIEYLKEFDAENVLKEVYSHDNETV